MNCSKCNAPVSDDSAFCPECGQKIEIPAPAAPAQVFCSECGTSMTAADAFCPNCGSKNEAAAAPAPEAPAAESVPTEKKPCPLCEKAKSLFAKIPTKVRTIGLAAIAVILVLVIVLSLIPGNAVNNYALYIKDGELQYVDMPKPGDPKELTGKLYDTDDNYYLNSLGNYYMSSWCKMSADGKTLFFPDKVESASDYSYEFTLYCINVNSKKEATKIESGISGYRLNEDGDLVTYLKNGNLYQHNLKEKTKIASDITSYRTSTDGKTLLYLNEDGDLYTKSGKKDAVKIASDVTDLYYCDDDCANIVYAKDESLYVKSGNKDAEKVASDVGYAIVHNESSMYIVEYEDVSITYWDLIDDDIADKDSWEYEYYAEWMKEDTIDMTSRTISYFNGKDTVTIAEDVYSVYDYLYDEAVIVYAASSLEDLPTWSLNEYINGDLYLVDSLYDYLDENATLYVANGDEAEAADLGAELSEIEDLLISTEGDKLYFDTDYDEEDETITLNEAVLNGCKIKSVAAVDEDVYADDYYFLNNTLYYFKEYDSEDYTAELYCGGEMIDEDVYTYRISYNTETDCLYYLSDYDYEDSCGTLKYFDGKKTVEVKDEVCRYTFTPGGEVLFLFDYNWDSYRGELWIQNGKKVEKIDDDVVSIITIY